MKAEEHIVAALTARDPNTACSLLVLLVLGIAYSASIGTATVMGASSNAVTAGFLADIRPWRFMNWMVYD